MGRRGVSLPLCTIIYNIICRAGMYYLLLFIMLIVFALKCENYIVAVSFIGRGIRRNHQPVASH